MNAFESGAFKQNPAPQEQSNDTVDLDLSVASVGIERQSRNPEQAANEEWEQRSESEQETREKQLAKKEFLVALIDQCKKFEVLYGHATEAAKRFQESSQKQVDILLEIAGPSRDQSMMTDRMVDEMKKFSLLRFASMDHAELSKGVQAFFQGQIAVVDEWRRSIKQRHSESLPELMRVDMWLRNNPSIDEVIRTL